MERNQSRHWQGLLGDSRAWAAPSHRRVPGAHTHPSAPEELRGERVEPALPLPTLAVSLLSGRKP